MRLTSLPRVRAPLALPALVTLLTLPAAGCRTWRAVPADGATPARLAERLDGRRDVRATLADGRVVELRDARLVGDSIVGLTGAPSARGAVAVRDVAHLDEQVVSRGRTTGLALGSTLVLVVLGTVVILGVLFSQLP